MENRKKWSDFLKLVDDPVIEASCQLHGTFIHFFNDGWALPTLLFYYIIIS